MALVSPSPRVCMPEETLKVVAHSHRPSFRSSQGSGGSPSTIRAMLWMGTGHAECSTHPQVPVVYAATAETRQPKRMKPTANTIPLPMLLVRIGLHQSQAVSLHFPGFNGALVNDLRAIRTLRVRLGRGR